MCKSMPPDTDNKNTTLLSCKNCDSKFTGNYCSNCGQSVKELERPIRFMIADFMGTIITFDTRLVKTLVTILFKPGCLTIDFLAGKRARYMPPFRFYLFISFVMFLLISIFTNSSIEENFNASSKELEATKNTVMAMIDPVHSGNDSVYTKTRKLIKSQLDSTTTNAIKFDDMNGFIDSTKLVLNSVENVDQKFVKTIKKIMDYPELYINKLYQFTSWSLFLFMPIFAFLLWLSFFRSRELYIGHLILSLNIHSFIFTITTIVVGINLLFPNHPTGWTSYFYFLPPIYQIIGAKRLYKRKWLSTILKLTLVWMMYAFIWLVGFIILVALTFVGL